MKTILLATAVALGLSSCAAPATTPWNGDASAATKPPSGVQTAHQAGRFGVFLDLRSPYEGPVTPSWSNPTGEVERGPNGEISLWAPCGCGGS
jgi:hypothetical protein